MSPKPGGGNRPGYIGGVKSASATRYLIPCRSGKHQVGLDPARFWRPAGCPVCKDPVDRWRVRRLLMWLGGRAPWSRMRLGRLEINPVEGMAAIWGLVIVAITVVFHTVADDWWLATVLLFLGRWPWVVPAVGLLVLAALTRRPRSVLVAAVPVVICLFGIMDLTIGVGRFLGSSDRGSRVRIVTYNVNGNAAAPRITDLVRAWRPDVLAIQECGGDVRDRVRRMPDYQGDVGNICLLTRFPIISADSLPRDAIEAAGGSAWVKRYRLRGPRGDFDLTNVHLDTPRKGFEALMARKGDAISIIKEKTFVRDLESRLARRWVDAGPGPRLVAGDFNMPDESAIFRQYWADLADGFDRAGFGFGYSRLNGWIRVRIDHVLADDHWVVRSARLLPDYGSDHLPVMVELELKTP